MCLQAIAILQVGMNGGMQMENEVWLPIKGYEGLYEISSLGRVKTVARRMPEIIRKPNIMKGYHCYALIKDGHTKVFRAHRLVAEHFIGPQPAPEYQVNHIDGNKANNCVDNLEWVTPKENTQHAICTGLRSQTPSEETKRKLSERSKELWKDETYAAEQSERMKSRWADPEYRKRTLANMRGKKRTPEQIEHYKAVPKITKPVMNVTTGKIYPSARVAAEEYGVTPEAIRSCIKGNSKKCKGCEWRYYE